MKGKDLIHTLIYGTGLPAEILAKELNNLLIAHRISEDQVTVDQIRDILADYLQDVLLAAKHEVGPECGGILSS